MTSSLRIAVVANVNSIHTTRWVNWLNDRGHQTQIFSLNEGENCTYFGPEPALDRSLIFNLGSAVRRTTKKLQSEIDSFGPDIVHGFSLVNHGMYASRISNYPKIVTAMGSDVLLAPKESKLLDWIIKKTVKQSDAIIGAPLLIDLIKEWEVNQNLNPNVMGVDCSLFIPLKKSNSIVFARGFEEVYNPIIVSKAIASLSSKLNKWEFIMCGKGTLEPKCKEILNNCKNVTFTGQLEIEKLAKIIGKAKLVISPSLSDSIPLSILEAVACGTPVVASNILANQKWVDAGLPVTIFDKHSVEDLSQKISEIATNNNFLQNALENGPGLIKDNFDWETQSRTLERVYFDLLR